MQILKQQIFALTWSGSFLIWQNFVELMKRRRQWWIHWMKWDLTLILRESVWIQPALHRLQQQQAHELHPRQAKRQYRRRARRRRRRRSERKRRRRCSRSWELKGGEEKRQREQEVTKSWRTITDYKKKHQQKKQHQVEEGKGWWVRTDEENIDSLILGIIVSIIHIYQELNKLLKYCV